jgi:RHS repeat-associated protein
VYEKTDLFLPDTIPLRFSRTYISGDSLTRSFGVGFTDVYDMFLIGDMNPYTFQDLILTDGNRIHFDRISKGTSYLDAVYVHATSPGSPFYGARLTWVPVVLGGINPGVPSHWKMTLKDGTTLLFPEASTSTNPWCQAVTQIIDRYSNIVNLTRTPTSNSPTGCNLTQVTSPNGRYITFTHDSQGRFKQAQDNIGRTVKYTYDAAGRLSTVTDVNNGVTTYTYNDQNQMTTIQDARGIVYLTNQYDPVSGRVAQQTLADNSTYLFSYIPTNNTAQTHFSASVGGNGGGGGSITETACWGPNGWSRSDSTCNAGYLPLVSQTDVTDPRGYIRELKFGPSGYVTSDSHAVGQPEQQTTTYNYYSDNLLQSVTDPLGRVTSFNYDANGNTASVTFLSGSSNSVSTTFTYEPAFNKLASVTDTLGHSNTFSYDTLGNLIAANDSLNHQSSFAYNGFGQLVSSTDAMNNTTQFSYAGGDLMSVTDPMGNQSTSVFDAAGRIISETEPLGATRAIQYNALNLVAQITDPAGGNTTFSYDPNGNVLSLTDANQHSTILTYDNMDRVQTRSDPLHRVETYAYDANGNLASSTDRKGQVTSVTYDALNRVKLVGYNTQVNGGNSTYESTVSYTYDAGNRVTQALDSAGSTITNVYDDLDHLTSQTTALGSISYTYDKAGRRATMQLAGQPQVAYTYDNANRLTGITESTSTVSFGYDNLNRRTSLTLPNGVTVVYGYDNDSRISALTYNFGANMLGNLTYTYDPAGRRIQVGGSFARTSLPGAIGAAAYDEANELTNWNGIPVSYDLNGNMQSDGTNLFTWNARNQVAKVNNVSLQYDAYGRRMQNVAGTSFLYDGGNAVQELSGTTTTANLLDGGVDELFTRTDPSGSFTPLQDALGTTIALIDANGNIQTTYSYDPFGNTTVSGAASSNPAQYTGRENENNGLYYYRARYYSPILHRFINEDPLGFAGSGANLYMYAEDNPVNFSDSFGLSSTEADAALADIHAILGPLDRFYATQNLSGRKEGNDLGIRSAEQSFGQCLSEHAKDYSLVGAYDLVAGTDYRESFGGSFFGGNHVMSLMQFVSGDTGEGPVLIPAGIQELAPEGMGMFANLMYQASFNYTLYAIPAINKGAGMSFMTQQAEQSAQIGSIMGSASTALETFNLVRLGVDIGFTLAEFAGCSMQR